MHYEDMAPVLAAMDASLHSSPEDNEQMRKSIQKEREEEM